MTGEAKYWFSKWESIYMYGIWKYCEYVIVIQCILCCFIVVLSILFGIFTHNTYKDFPYIFPNSLYFLLLCSLTFFQLRAFIRVILNTIFMHLGDFISYHVCILFYQYIFDVHWWFMQRTSHARSQLWEHLFLISTIFFLKRHDIYCLYSFECNRSMSTD